MVATAPPLPADVEPRAARALQRNHPEYWLLFEGRVIYGRSLGAVARGLGLDPDTATSELDDARLILAAHAQGLWQGEDEEFDFAECAQRLGISEERLRSKLAGTEEALAAAELKRHHPQKWDVYHRCIELGLSQNRVATATGLSVKMVSAHPVDAVSIVAAYLQGMWDPDDDGPFSFPRTARQLGTTDRELRRQLVDLAAKERECAYCHRAYKPKKFCESSPYCGKTCTDAAARERSAKVCPIEGCGARIGSKSNACFEHYRLLKQPKPCQRCGDAYLAAPSTRCCPECGPVVLRERTRGYRAKRREREARKQADSRGRVISMADARRARKARFVWVQEALPLELDEPERRRRVR